MYLYYIISYYITLYYVSYSVYYVLLSNILYVYSIIFYVLYICSDEFNLIIYYYLFFLLRVDFNSLFHFNSQFINKAAVLPSLSNLWEALPFWESLFSFVLPQKTRSINAPTLCPKIGGMCK